MAPTPPRGDSPNPAPGAGQAQHEERIRRNVACISCRDSKVRCRADTVTGMPCQRCAKLSLLCVYDKSHKRITKRSKLELLEAELKTIKEAVRPPRVNEEQPWNPPTPQHNNTIFPQQGTPNSLSSLPPIQLDGPSQPAPPVPFEKTGPTKSRLLGDKLVSGDDIDWYFKKFIQCFHPYVPVLRKRDPDECYQANPTLFWTVIYVASRRYAREEHVFRTLIDQLGRDIWLVASTPNLDLEAIHAILLLCAWPFPTTRFVTDPSTMLITVAMNACMLLGLHYGRGNHTEFCVGGRQHFHSTDLDASNTWMACSILAQRIATYSGIVSPFLQHYDAQCKKAVEDTMSSELMTLFELQKFTNRMHTAMAGQIAQLGGVHESTVRAWEDEFETLQPFVTRVDTDCSHFFLLSARLEVQSYYFLTPASSPPPEPLQIFRAFTTSQSLIATALALERASKFLAHGPQWTYRALVDASCIVVSTLHATVQPAGITPDRTAAHVEQVNAAVQSCIVREGDLPSRGAVILDTFWSVRHLIPKFAGTRRAWPRRLGVAVTFWCLMQFKTALQKAKKSTEGVNRGLEAFQNNTSVATTDNNTSDQALAESHDIFQDIDWSLLMDDFGWQGDGAVFLGPPQC